MGKLRKIGRKVKRGFKSFVSPFADFLALIIIREAILELELTIGKIFISPAPSFKIDKISDIRAGL